MAGWDRRPLERSARQIALDIGPDCDVVLLGSIASAKGRGRLAGYFRRAPGVSARTSSVEGTWSRGGLMLRRASAREELVYVPVGGAVRHGQRPPKLDRGRA